MISNPSVLSQTSLESDIKTWSQNLGFDQTAITDLDVSRYQTNHQDWLAQQFHGEMAYMLKHAKLRFQPALLLPNAIRAIITILHYLPPHTNRLKILNDPHKAYISRYALGRDYHKLIRKRLSTLAQQIQSRLNHYHFRVFTDSAPVLEKPLAEKAGIGWIGKNTLLLNRQSGSWFFIGVIYTDAPLIIDQPTTSNHCGTCQACINVCPTKAIVAPYQLDARKCISYLTIEYKGSIPPTLRPLMGNRIFGCDDCQLCCPWNRFAKYTEESDFKPRHGLDTADLIELFKWSEETFLKKTEGSAIRRAGYIGWLRNIAIALGNAPSHLTIIMALKERAAHPSPLVREHVVWALGNHGLE